MQISGKVRSLDDRDFEFLRSEGLKYVEELSRKLWTDYNSHDPGVTILEALCYAITDLGNRIQLPMKDLLAASAKTDSNYDAGLPTAKRILTSGAVSETDYRRLFIDIKGVKNAFIQPFKQRIYTHCLQKMEATEAESKGQLGYVPDLGLDYEKTKEFDLKGLNKILFEPELSIQMLGEAERKDQIEQIKNSIKTCYHKNRNLCEDLVEVEPAEILEILVCGDLEIEADAVANEVMAEFLFRVQQYLSPAVNRYALKDLLDRNRNVESIFEGPILKNGFILAEELDKANFRQSIHLSDLIRIAKETPGIKKIKKLNMRQCPSGSKDCSERDASEEKWTICFPQDHQKVLRTKLDPSIERTNLFKDVVPISVEKETVRAHLLKKQLSDENSRQFSFEDLMAEKGNALDVGFYSTVQNDLPELYGTGTKGFSSNLPPERKSKVLQLKGYLLFFDQIIATYFAHLKETTALLSPDVQQNSYFPGAIANVADVEKLVGDYDSFERNLKDSLNAIDASEERKNSFLNHLISRFAENIDDYAFLLDDQVQEELQKTRLDHKSSLLRDYPEISYRRFQSFDYFAGEDKAWNTKNVPGLKQRLAHLLGIKDYRRKDLINPLFEIVKDESGTQWNWILKDDEGVQWLKGVPSYAEKENASTKVWDAIQFSTEQSNYRIKKDEDIFRVFLVDGNDDDLAIMNKEYTSKVEAEEEIKSFSILIYERHFQEGMFLFENILLRPEYDDPDAGKKFMNICMDPDCTQCPPYDPYSLRLTVILPGWTRRFSNMYYRQFAENLIRKEVPAHLLTRICWIGPDSGIGSSESETTEPPQMKQLQNLYKNWLLHKMQFPDKQRENEFLKPLIDVIHNLQTIYPQGRLHDCQNSDEQFSSIVLGRSTIGDIKNTRNDE